MEAWRPGDPTDLEIFNAFFLYNSRRPPGSAASSTGREKPPALASPPEKRRGEDDDDDDGDDDRRLYKEIKFVDTPVCTPVADADDSVVGFPRADLSIVSTLKKFRLPVEWMLVRIDDFVNDTLKKKYVMKETQACFKTKVFLTYYEGQIDGQYENAVDELNARATAFAKKRPGWKYVKSSERRLNVRRLYLYM